MPRFASAWILGLVVVAVGACGIGSPSGPSLAPSVAPANTAAPSTPTASPMPAPASDPPPPSPSLLGGPPIARLAAEGGDPVDGQLGTYTWASGGSDSPWLPGAPIRVGAGEPLSVTFEPVLDVEAWRALLVPAAADGPAGARRLGEGGGSPRFAAPGPGVWTLAVEVTFADGLGSASYAWAVTVP